MVNATQTPQLTENPYRWATGLVGFGSDCPVRVRVTEIRDGLAWVVTADLRSAGCPLTLDASQVVEVAE